MAGVKVLQGIKNLDQKCLMFKKYIYIYTPFRMFLLLGFF